MSHDSFGHITAQTRDYAENVNTETINTFFGKKLKVDRERVYTYNLSNGSTTKKKADRTINGLLSQGWKLDSSALDTIYTEVTQKAPDTEIKAISLTFNDKAFFESGKFEVNEQMKNDIIDVINLLTQSGGQILKIDIKSSTDKQKVSDRLNNTLKSLGFESGNKGLSQARSANISDYLVNMGISDTIINVTNLSEQGKNEIDQNSRYVTIDFIYLEIPKTSPRIKNQEKIEYVVKISKKEEFDIKNKNNKKSGSGSPSSTKTTKVKKQKSRGALGCPTFRTYISK